MKTKPSDYFLGAILRGYEAEAAGHKPVHPSGIWDRIVIECLHCGQRFDQMFAWDTSRAMSRNRIKTIIETILAGYVPGLRMDTDTKGRAIVVRS